MQCWADDFNKCKLYGSCFVSVKISCVTGCHYLARFNPIQKGGGSAPFVSKSCQTILTNYTGQNILNKIRSLFKSSKEKPGIDLFDTIVLLIFLIAIVFLCYTYKYEEIKICLWSDCKNVPFHFVFKSTVFWKLKLVLFFLCYLCQPIYLGTDLNT